MVYRLLTDPVATSRGEKLLTTQCYAVTKVLDGFCCSAFEAVGPSCDSAGFCFVPCFLGGILVAEVNTYGIIMY